MDNIQGGYKLCLLVLARSSSHTSRSLHRRPRFGSVDVLFRQKAVGFSHRRKAIRRFQVLPCLVFLHKVSAYVGLFLSDIDKVFRYLRRYIPFPHFQASKIPTNGYCLINSNPVFLQDINGNIVHYLCRYSRKTYAAAYWQ